MKSKNERLNRKYPYMDPLPVYSWWDLIGGVVVMISVGLLAWWVLANV